MAKRKKQRDYSKYENPFLYDRRDGESDLHYYRRLAKQADQRLVRIEQLSGQEKFKNVTKYSYARAIRDIQGWSGYQATRFNTKPPENKKQLMAKIADMRNFLEAPTSTKSGIIAVYQQRADTINKKYGTDFTWEDLGNYFEAAKASNTESKYGSSTELRAMAVIQANQDAVKKQIEQHKKKHITVDNPHLQDAIDDMLKDRKLKVQQFFKG